MPTRGHCQACTLWVDAGCDEPGALVGFVRSCRTALEERATVFTCEPRVIEAWFDNLQSSLHSDSASPDVCAIDWVIDRLGVYIDDPYREIISLWYEGDDEAFERLYLETRSALVAKATRVVGDDAEDLVENFFVELYESWAQGLPRYFPYRGAFLPYAFRCIIRRAFSHSTRIRRQQELADSRFRLFENQTTESPADDITLDVQRIIDGTPLSEDERAALELSADGWSGDEIAETLEMSPATVTRRLASAFGKLANKVRGIVSTDQLIIILRELTTTHKQRAAAVFLHYALPEFDTKLREFGLETIAWPVKYEAASLRAAELYKEVARQSEDHPICQLILRHAVEPWGARLWRALDGEHEIPSPQGEN